LLVDDSDGLEMLAQISSSSQISEVYHFDTPIDQFLVQEASSSDMMQMVHEEPSKKCLGSLMAMDIKDDMFLVGDIFMRKFYSVFDRDNDRVGLAKSVHG
jgi:cathepsin D